MVSPGAYLSVGQQITEVAAIDEMKITFSSPERYLAQLRRGAAVQITSTAYPNDLFSGTISVVDPLIDPVSHTVQLEARIPNRAHKLRPGMSADVTATLGERPHALIVPDEAVFGEGNQNFVYVVKPDSTVTRQAVVLGARDSARAEIVSGVKEGDQVVRAGYQKLFEGAHVMPVPPGGVDASAGAGGAPGGAGAAPGGAKAAKGKR
jgi:membrane fusion protein (multidrug efflux system)